MLSDLEQIIEIENRFICILFGPNRLKRVRLSALYS
jgi:hypothetical protein